jgi:hypothetical protein
VSQRSRLFSRSKFCLFALDFAGGGAADSALD